MASILLNKMFRSTGVCHRCQWVIHSSSFEYTKSAHFYWIDGFFSNWNTLKKTDLGNLNFILKKLPTNLLDFQWKFLIISTFNSLSSTVTLLTLYNISFQAYHSQISKVEEHLSSFALLPIRTQTRGPAPTTNGEDIIDETIYYFKANIFFRTYEIKVSPRIMTDLI